MTILAAKLGITLKGKQKFFFLLLICAEIEFFFAYNWNSKGNSHSLNMQFSLLKVERVKDTKVSKSLINHDYSLPFLLPSF